MSPSPQVPTSACNAHAPLLFRFCPWPYILNVLSTSFKLLIFEYCCPSIWENFNHMFLGSLFHLSVIVKRCAGDEVGIKGKRALQIGPSNVHNPDNT